MCIVSKLNFFSDISDKFFAGRTRKRAREREGEIKRGREKESEGEKHKQAEFYILRKKGFFFNLFT